MFAPGSARAQVTEPNGVQVPVTCPTGETCLQAYFNGLNPPDAINALTEASVNPGTYSPPCSFQAELVLSQAANAAGLGWYNVPADATSKPTAVYALVPESAMVGTKVSSATIRTDPNYAGGLIGFALMEGGSPVYYSEYMRNVLCSGCTTPDHWKLMLAYASKLASNTYYLAFEDMPGASTTSWPNDGDFNDKVFKLTGVRCPGGGEPCDTGKLGVCAQGLTECQVNQPLLCKQLVQPKAEVCDGVDNDCDGVVDGPGLCNAGMVCLRGVCVKSCLSQDYVCPPGEACDEEYCVETKCVGVRCDAGKVCRNGVCVAPCDGIVCPLGHVCRAGQCVDPCAGVTCDAGRVCRAGVCVEKCDCAGCPATLACDAPTGSCIDTGCPGKVCPAGTVCSKGNCVDPCANTMCPGGRACVNGKCEDPPPPPIDAGSDGSPPGSGGAAGSGSDGSAGSGGNAGSAGTGGSAGAAGTTGTDGSAGTGGNAGAAGNTGTGGIAGNAGANTGGNGGSAGGGGSADASTTGGTGGAVGGSGGSSTTTTGTGAGGSAGASAGSAGTAGAQTKDARHPAETSCSCRVETPRSEGRIFSLAGMLVLGLFAARRGRGKGTEVNRLRRLV
jgi:hypothetical protein